MLSGTILRKKGLIWMALGAAMLLAPATASYADTYPVGYVSYDVTGTGVAQFDITNLTGPNSSGDATFPVTTSLSFTDLSLDVSFASGPDEVFTGSYFTLNSDGLSWDGTALSTLSGQPSGLAGAISATLTGTFGTTVLTLYDGSSIMVDPSFTATITDVAGLTDGDLAIIDVSTSGSTGPPPPVPEPEPFLLVGTGVLGLMSVRARRLLGLVRSALPLRKLGMGTVMGVGVLMGASLFAVRADASVAAVKLSTWTVPSSGASGSTIVTLTGSNFPTGTVVASNVTLSFGTSCMAAPAATESPTTVTTVLAGTKRMTFTVPASLSTGTYYISTTGEYPSSNCAEVTVTHTSSTLAACLPSSSLAVLTGKNVDAYVPKGSWGGYGETGISLVPIEGTDTASALSTPQLINSCSSNSATGETVCVDNYQGVYELTGNKITNTLTSGSGSGGSFSGGECENCGVAIDALTNTAVISGGFAGNSSNNGVQLLNLANNTFSTPFPSQYTVSENVSIDPNRNLILSPDEDDYYDIFKIAADGSLTEFANYEPVGGEFDSAAEDCTTGIALATQEFTNNLYLVDLTQAEFFPAVPPNTAGTWTAPGQSITLNTYSFSAGTDGISVAAGTTHLGITTGEFGGNTFAAFQLPATSGTGTPNLVDYAGAALPNTPDGETFSAGYDPHTITAYTSPNNGKAYGLISDWVYGYPTWVAVIDLQALLNAPRTSSNTVDPTYDLVAHGVVRYVAVP